MLRLPRRTSLGQAPRRLRAAAALLVVLGAALAGCAGVPSAPPASGGVELDDVPFFPQTEYQCGPAALATILAHEGLAVTADDLVDDVYVEGLHGSLQAELLGATRRHGLIPYVLEPAAEALFGELAAGRPVLVLQNLGLPRFPVWHYAVVVGYDPAAGRVILRSGTERRRVEPLRRFERSVERAGHWAFVALEPGTLPATAEPLDYVRALAGAEPLLRPDAAARAHAAALARWPDEPPVLFAAAARAHADGRLEEAAALYRRLLERAPGDAAARNNLANVLADEGCVDAALREARAALAAAGEDGPLAAAIVDTVAGLERAQSVAGDRAGCF
ncbi:MAG TPA: PA2778 family cysteine peptidase [Gammaproteobacteria bacterium]